LRAAAAAAIAFAAVTGAVALGLTRGIDAVIIDPFITFDIDTLDLISGLLSILGGIEITGAIAVLLAIVAVRRGGWPGAAPLLMFVAVAIEVVLKFVVPQPLPPSPPVAEFSLPMLRLETPYSFPSGHELRTTFLAVVLAPLQWRWAAALFVAVMAASRVYVVQHWPSDVVGGLLLGLAFGLVARRPYFDAWRRDR
jgi:undecaprenyl-diphosphatase